MEHLSESDTRQQLIDRQLARAGWNEGQVTLVEEFLISTGSGKGDLQFEGFADYVLLDRDDQPVAVVEAKRTGRDELAGKRQAAEYADAIKDKYDIEPFIFLTNGLKIWLWDRALYPPREVSAFFSPADLADLQFIRRYRKPLSSVVPDPTIAGRDYQAEAIKRVTENLEKGHRKFLLVMATGTGKTRTAVSLVELLTRSKWIQRVLFLVDRRELAKQAAGAFKDYLPREIPYRIESGHFDDDAYVHIATYPSMMQVHEQLSPGYYDLIIADESHRSIYNKYEILFDRFDGLQLGLTATPTDYIDHNTFQLFNCEDGLPTFYYSYEEAVEEEYLADYKVLEANTAFQIEGIKAGELPAEVQRQLEEQGIELSEVDFEGSDLERRVTNTGTNDALVREYMDKSRKDATGTLSSKTVFFCMSHNHAKQIWKSFNRLYPSLQRRGFAEIIDSHMERAENTLDDFKNKNMPRVAISVDMLDTGIDVPEIQNLVFAKPVYSQVKFWQMIGRGTRRWTNPETGRQKEDFLIIDHWDNFSYFKMNPEGEVAGSTVPLPIQLFRTRLGKLLLLQDVGVSTHAVDAAAVLAEMLSVLPKHNTNVRPHLLDLHEFQQPDSWTQLSDERLKTLHSTIAPLCRFTPEVNLEVMTFERRVEQLAVAFLQRDGDTVQTLREKILADLRLLPTQLQEVQAREEHLRWALSDGFWTALDYERIMALQEAFAPLMRYRRRQRSDMVYLNLPDKIATRRWIMYGPSGEGAFAESYQKQVEARIRTLADEDPILRSIRLGRPVEDEDLKTLARRLESPDLYITEEVLRELYEQPNARMIDFLRSMLGVSELPSREDQIKAAFSQYIQAHPSYTAIQINFLRVVRSAIVRRSKLTPADLENPPFTRLGSVHQLFSDQEIEELLTFANALAA